MLSQVEIARIEVQCVLQKGMWLLYFVIMTSNERIYKILSIVCHIAFALMAALMAAGSLAFALAFALDMFFHVSDAVALFLFASLFVPGVVGSLWLCRRFLYRYQEPALENGKDRLGSLVLWGTPSIVGMNLSLFLGWLSESEIWVAPFFAVPVAAFCLAMFWPFQKHQNGLPVHLLTFLGMFWTFLFLGFVLARTGKPVEYRGDNVQEIPHLTKWQKKNYFPANATNIVVEGSTAYFNWECLVNEKDFRVFEVQWGFQKIDTSETPTFQAPYFLYDRRSRNGGGVTMHYFPSEQKLTGQYSHH